MKIKRMLLVTMALVAVGTPSRCGAQDMGFDPANRMAAWLGPAGGGYNCASCAADCGAAADPCYAEDFYCDNGRCGDCVGCCRTWDTWGSIEFLMWWGKGSSFPPLVTSSPQGTPRADAGVLGQPDTSIRFGDQLGAQKLQVGGRVAVGAWLDPEHNLAAGARFFALGGDTTRYTNTSVAGNPILARPFFNALLGQQDALLIGFPDVAEGSIEANVNTRNILGAEALVEIMMDRDVDRRVDLVAGYQFLRLDDALLVHSNITDLQPGPLQGTTFDITDRFQTRNEFHGGEVGLKGRMARGCWSLDALGKVGIGNLRERVVIFGQTTITSPGGTPGTSPGGLLAQPSNIGSFHQDKFTFIPEVTMNLTYYVNRCVSLHIGYNIIWLSNVVLSGDQVDLRVNPSQIVGPPLPAFTFHDRDYWLQGLNFGMNWDF